MNATAQAPDRCAPAILILADDLSGAADCGIACAEAGLETVVALRPGLAGPPAGALAIDGDTRTKTAEAAAEITERLALSYGQNERSLVFKKLDSTLRGHVGPELNAVLCAVRTRRRDAIIILAPAFPALGRTTVNGNQRLHGAPLEESEIWRLERRDDTASLPTTLRAHRLRAGLLPLDRVRGAVVNLAAAMQDLADHSDVVICDAETDSDLAAVAGASLQLRSKIVWAGAAALARQVVEVAGLAKPQAPFAAPVFDGSAVFVVGSRSSLSKRQAARLAALDGVVSLETDPTSTLQQLRSSGVAAQLGAALAAGNDAIIWRSDELQEASTMQARPYGLSQLLASEKHRIGALFATGGDTARCLLEALDVEALEPLRELESGVPLSIAIGPRRFPVITKAGAFGTDTTMTRCRSLLRRGAPLSAMQISESEG